MTKNNRIGRVLLCITYLQYFVVQIIAATRWKSPAYSWSGNAISDLGNTACGQFSGRFVCSPAHVLMNVSFIVLGFGMIAGISVWRKQFFNSVVSRVGVTAMLLAGLGTILVGIFPENTLHIMHAIGAVLAIAVGDIGLVVLAGAYNNGQKYRIYTYISGIVGLLAFVLYVLHIYAGLGEGGMERVAAYPQTIWLMVSSLYFARLYKAKFYAKAVNNRVV